MRTLVTIVAVALAATLIAACGADEASSGRAERGTTVIDVCRDHGGVTAFDDDAVICADQTSVEERGSKAVDACRGHDGVSAFDDDIVICRDQSFHEAPGG